MSQESVRDYKFHSKVLTKNEYMLRIFNKILRQQITTRKVSEHVGVNPATIRNWGYGVTEPSISQFIRMADYLGYHFQMIETAATSNTPPLPSGQQSIAPEIQENHY